MRTNVGFESMKVSKEKLLEINFHDFLTKSMYLNDEEIAQEFGMTTRELEILKNRIRR